MRRRQLLALASGSVVVGLLAACTSGPATVSAGSSGSGHPSSQPPRASTSPTAPVQVTAKTTQWQLPTPLQRSVVLAAGPTLHILGGLTAADASTAAVLSVDPAKATAPAAGPSLPSAVHDAAGAVINGKPTLFGGGSASSVSTVQQPGTQPIGQLPTVRSDLAAAAVGNTVYLVGGYDGTTPRRDVLATTDGRTFRTVATLPEGVRYPAVAALGSTVYIVGGELASGASTTAIVALNTTTDQVRIVGQLPQPLSHASAMVLDNTVVVAGGTNGTARTDQIWRINTTTGVASSAGLLPYAVADAGSAVLGGVGYLVGGTGNGNATLATAVQLSATRVPEPASYSHFGPGHLAPGSDPSVLPGPVLIADRTNNRLIEVSPEGQVLWQFPRPGDLAPGQPFTVPDDAFFSPDGKQIIVTEEDAFVVTLIDVATHKIIWRYGQPGTPGSGPNRLSNPDDAMVLPTGQVVIADIKNCRLVVIDPGAHTLAHSYGQVGTCRHNPPAQFGSPNGAFPLADGNWLVTEINGAWVSEMAPGGTVLWSVHLPQVAYPSDTNQIGTDRYLTADYSTPGQVVIFNRAGQALWRYRPTGAAALNHPSLALPLPNGDIILNDDRNNRVIVVDPRTDQVVWQYGVTGQPGATPGMLNNPDGIDLAPPHSLLGTHAATLRVP